MISELVALPAAAAGRHTVKVLGRAATSEQRLPLGEINFNVTGTTSSSCKIIFSRSV